MSNLILPKTPKLLQGNILLLLTAILWGVAFIFQKTATETMDAFSFNTLRFGIAVFALLPLLLLPKKLFAPEKVTQIGITTNSRQVPWFIAGGVAGFIMFLGISLQQWGLNYTTAGKSGFLTSLYIIFVPILALLIKQRCGPEVWAGAILTIIGIYIMGQSKSNVQSELNLGDSLTFLSAWCWAAQVLWLSIVAKYSNVLYIVITQIAVVAICSLFALLIFVTFFDTTLPRLDDIFAAKTGILYTAVISTSVAFTLQLLGQRHVPAANAALIMSLEGVFAMIAGILFLNEVITLTIFIGCCFIFAGILLAQLREFIKK